MDTERNHSGDKMCQQHVKLLYNGIPVEKGKIKIPAITFGWTPIISSSIKLWNWRGESCKPQNNAFTMQNPIQKWRTTKRDRWMDGWMDENWCSHDFDLKWCDAQLQIKYNSFNHLSSIQYTNTNVIYLHVLYKLFCYQISVDFIIFFFFAFLFDFNFKSNTKTKTTNKIKRRNNKKREKRIRQLTER